MEAALLSRCTGQLSRLGFAETVFAERLSKEPRLASELRSMSGSVASCLDIDGGPCNRFCLAGGADAKITLYDLERSRFVARSARRERTHAHSVVKVAWYGGDAGAFVSCSVDGAVCLWDAERFKAVRRFKLTKAVAAASLSRCKTGATATLVATACGDATIRLSDVRSAAAYAAELGGVHRGAVTAVSWSPTNAHELCSGGADSSARLWDVRRSGSTACVGSLDAHKSGAANNRVASHLPWAGARHIGRAHEGSIDGIEYTGDGRQLLTAGSDEALKLWDVATASHEPLHFVGFKNRSRGVGPLGICVVRDIAFVPNGEERRVVAYSLRTGRCKWKTPSTPQNLRGVRCCAFREATQQLVTSADDGHHVISWTHSNNPPAALEEQDEDEEDDEEEGDGAIEELRRQILRARREDAVAREAADVAEALRLSEAAAAAAAAPPARSRRRPRSNAGRGAGTFQSNTRRRTNAPAATSSSRIAAPRSFDLNTT